MKISSFHFIRLDPGKESSDQDLFDYELQCIDFAEEFGLDGVWLAEHHFRSDVCPSILPVAAHVAARTKRIRIGLGILVLPFYDPLRLAEDVAVVDILSQGRINVGMGRGYNTMEFNGFSVSQDESRERFAETLEIAIAAWSKGTVCHHGKFYQIENVRVFPAPIQKPHPPLWIGASSPETVERCGAMGIPFMSDPAQTFAESVELVRRWSASAKAAGHDPDAGELAALRPIWVADSVSEAIRARPVWVPQCLDDIAGDQADIASSDIFDLASQEHARAAAPTDLDPALEREVGANPSYLVGDPDSIIKKLVAYQEAGYRHILGVFNSGVRQPIENVRECMQRFSEEVLPYVKDL